MSALLVDIGNTRVKWARWERGRLGRQHAVGHADWNAKLLAAVAERPVDKIVVVSVASTKLNQLVFRALRSVFGVEPTVVRSARRLGGVVTRYREPWRLGTDRLIAAIGGHHLAPGRAVCVADIGTAMTIDLVDAHGVHLGGAIVPGPRLMIESLLKDTSGIQRRAGTRRAGTRSALFALLPDVGRATANPRPGTGRLFARDTRAAIEQGSRHATAAVIDRAVAEARLALGVLPVVLLTGGAAGEVRQLVRARHRLVPDLVLRGLAQLA